MPSPFSRSKLENSPVEIYPFKKETTLALSRICTALSNA